MKYILFLFLFFSLSSLKLSHDINNFNHCKVTKKASNNYEPAKFNKSNNLTNNKTKQIIIKGILQDSFCVPIEDAKIYIWQTDENGKYRYKMLRSKFESDGEEESEYQDFKGSGIATTNNLGEFMFVTDFPGPYDKEHPNINFRIEHRVLGTLQTKFYLHKKEISSRIEKTNLKFNFAKQKMIPSNKITQEYEEDFFDAIEEQINHDIIFTEKIEPLKFKIYNMDHDYELISPDNQNNYHIQITLPTKKNYKRY